MNPDKSRTCLIQYLVLCIVFIFTHQQIDSQEEFNSSSDLKVELKASKIGTLTSVESDFFYRINKHSYFAGVGLGFHSRNNSMEPILKLGYRKYPGKNNQALKFFYQTFLYYSTRHIDYYIKPETERYLTANYGIGVNYESNTKFSAGVSSNVGWGWNFFKKSGIFTIFPAQITIGYSFH